ncbi:MarR family winged helix-turn-helix transcriptional regulator [Microbacterium sp. p3-SID336]|uniref:MarR family winged helix-turn-helix transcriptional regulator n=1 Tax=Microbacterium sp. p3-SID336 TaxID=2916212 RepID=UPI0021A8C749|nr:MarR family transcriptional regulator [Microbacterium sp. p3-SID336]MCT1479117.1 MarR family transcriptional regulator [Microbacterium sp. p3-SID336]
MTVSEMPADAPAAIGAVLYDLATRAARRLPRDMSLTSAATLATLQRTGPRRITDLAMAERVTQPAMTALVRVMEESGLVQRRGDPSDRRVTLVWLTEAGAEYVRRRRRLGIQAFERLIGGLGGGEAEALLAALPALEHLAELERADRGEGSEQQLGSGSAESR